MDKLSTGDGAARGTRFGSLALVLGAVVFFAAEFLSSRGWIGPQYSYISNFISELGIPVVLEHINSPLHALMNTGFVAYGLLIVLGYALLKKALPTGRLATVAVILLIASGIGVILVGFFPGYQWRYSFVHTTGAMLVIYAGNVGDILISTGLVREKSSRFAVCGIVLGIVGIVSSIVMAMNYTSVYAGLYERLAIYPTIIFNLALGLSLLLRGKSALTANADTGGTVI